ncbi:MAG: LLM class flavin-dependent oxidoreductase [Mycobacteriales bacterium]
MHLRVGLHAGQQFATFAECLDLWVRAEALGYDWVSVFDHYRPPLGGPDGPCLEGPTLLAALAARTGRVRCGMLVLGVHHRHPAAVASIAATLDQVSGGRLELGLGAGGPDLAHEQWGLPWPAPADRVALLDETCRILRSLWQRDRTTHHGRWFRLEGATLQPKPVQSRLPLVIGGAGPRLLRVAAEHADVWNTLPGTVHRYRATAGLLSDRCADVGRDPAAIRRSITFRAVLGETPAEVSARRDEVFGRLPAGSPDLAEYLSVGTPEQCVADLLPYAELGVRDFLLGARPPVDWRTVELMATAVAPALRAAVG